MIDTTLWPPRWSWSELSEALCDFGWEFLNWLLVFSSFLSLSLYRSMFARCSTFNEFLLFHPSSAALDIRCYSRSIISAWSWNRFQATASRSDEKIRQLRLSAAFHFLFFIFATRCFSFVFSFSRVFSGCFVFHSFHVFETASWRQGNRTRMLNIQCDLQKVFSCMLHEIVRTWLFAGEIASWFHWLTNLEGELGTSCETSKRSGWCVRRMWGSPKLIRFNS